LLLPAGLLFCDTPHFGHIAALISISEPQFKQCFVFLGEVSAADSDDVESSLPTVTLTSVDVSGDIVAGSLSSEMLIPPKDITGML
jgi:hypothetical protein